MRSISIPTGTPSARRSSPPDSWLCAATMIAEIGDCRERYPSYRALAADAGQAPVAVESGKAKHAQFR